MIGLARQKWEEMADILKARPFTLETGWSGWAGLGINRRLVQSASKSSFSYTV